MDISISTSILGDQAMLLAVLDKFPHLLACRFCHRPIMHITADSVEPLDLKGVKYTCGTYFVGDLQQWVRHCHWLSWLTLPLKRGIRYVLIRTLLLLKE